MIKSHVDSLAKYAGLTTTIIEWSALLIYYLKKPLYFGSKYPISYFATLPETRWVFTVCYVLAAISFWVFAKHYLSKYYHVPTRTFGISLLLFAGTGLFPLDLANPVSVTIHSMLALSSGGLFVGGMYLMAQNTNDKLLLRITVAAIICSLTLTAAFLLSPKSSHLIFTFEAGSWLMLQLWTIWVTLYTHKNERAEMAQ